jgi:DNA-binding response OmpR family regulator
MVFPPMNTRPRRILVVDDNVDSGEMLGVALTMAGHDVHVVHDPFTAAAVADELAADVVVLDIGMPGRDGYGVAADILERFGDRAPSLIALTGFSQSADRARTAAAGFGAHFVKPVNLPLLIAHIGAL